MGVKKIKKFTMTEKIDISKMYLNNISTVKIGEKYGVSHKTIAKILDEFNIKRTGRCKRKYSIDENYFDSIDTPNKAYILGFLYADGNNNPSKGTISMSLEEKDWHILEKMRLEIKSEKPLQYIDYSNKNDFGYKYKNQYRLIFFSSHMCNILNNLGMYANKSLKLMFPDFLRNDLVRHFIRGYFDGDGSFCCYYTKNNKKQTTVTFTSTESFCIELKKYISENVNIPCGNIYDASCKNGITKVLSFCGNAQTKKFLDWLYQDADMFLFRKYNKYIETFYPDNSLMA